MVNDRGLPTLEGMTGVLAPYRGKNAYIVEFVGPRQPAVGNNGDVLLDRVMRRVLRHAGVGVTDTPASADLLLVRPGGALLDRFLAPSLLTRRLARLPDLPLIVLPHSSWFEHSDPSEMFGRRKASTVWVSRERESDRRLRSDWGQPLARAGVELALDHDMVITGRQFLSEVMEGQSPERPSSDLLVARMGAEATAMASVEFRPASVNPLHRAKRLAVRSLPTPLQHTLRRRTTAARQKEQNAAVLRRLDTDVAENFSADVRDSFDVSDLSLCTFGHYSRSILGARRVVTNRLHVGIPAALLGKQTWLVDSGYHKLRGVYEHSLAELDVITLIAQTDAA